MARDRPGRCPSGECRWLTSTPPGCRPRRAHRYTPADFERCYRLAALLADIGRSPWLRGRVALKGGTPINFFHDDLPRLSVDMDLNYVGSLDRETMQRERPELEQALKEIATARGYTVDPERRSYSGSQTRLLYANLHGQRDSIRVDLNYLMRLPLYGVERRELPAIFELDGDVPTLAVEDVYGGKLKALAVRAQPRPLRRRTSFSGSVRPEPRKLRAAFLFYCHMDDATLGLVDLERARGLTDRDVKQNLHPMLRRGEKPSATELQDAVLPRLEAMLQRSHDEVRYGEELEQGHHRPELLFGAIDVAGGIKDHPAALWRAKDPHGKRSEAG